MKYYVIRNKDNHDEFWSNELGWADRGYADEFLGDAGSRGYALPFGGEWVMEAEDEKDSKFKWFNLVGNPINGFRLLGPFASYEDAVEWQEGCDESCWVIESESEGLY